MRQITLTIDSDGKTCRGCTLPEYTGDGDCYCPAAYALGASDRWLQVDSAGIPLCLPECARCGQKREAEA